uniref:SMP-30/gluconolactonase/LRE family protein n=1 Tax=Oceaniglobus roseus TaxID=1737570 RepID=UPI001561E5CC
MAHTALADSFHALIDVDAPVRQLGTGYTFTEGPLWHPLEKHLVFSDMPADVRRRYTPGQGVKEIQRPSNKGNGMTYDAELNLLVCEHSTSSVVRIRPDGRREVMCSHYKGRELNSPNDIVVGNDGAIYFTDPTYGRMAHFGVPRPTHLGFQGVYRMAPGHRPGDEPELVVDRYLFKQPNGLCFSPCQKWMWVNDTDEACIRMFDVAEDGKLVNGRLFAGGIRDRLKPGLPDGMKADKDGNVWVTAPGGVWVYSFEGALIGKLSVPEMVANLHWGGEDWSTLFLCASTSLYSVQTKTKGRDEPFMYPKGQARPAPAPEPVAAPQARPVPPAAFPSATSVAPAPA